MQMFGLFRSVRCISIRSTPRLCSLTALGAAGGDGDVPGPTAPGALLPHHARHAAAAPLTDRDGRTEAGRLVVHAARGAHGAARPWRASPRRAP